MLRINPLLPTVAGLLLGVSACVSVPKEDLETRRLALLASQNQDWPQAMDLWNHVLSHQGSQDAQARLHLGRALLESGRGLGAIQVLRAGSPAAGTELQHGLLLARAHFSQNQVRAGSRVLSGLLADHAANVELLTLYGTGLLDGDREAKGLGLLLQALRIEVGDGAMAEQVARRASILKLDDMQGEAWTLRLQAPQPPVEAYLGAAEWELGKAAKDGTEPAPEVSLNLERAVEIDPLNGRAWALLGDLHVSAGANLEARQAYRKAVEVDPADWHACHALAAMYVKLGNCTEATVWIEHALASLTDGAARKPFEELARSCE